MRSLLCITTNPSRYLKFHIRSYSGVSIPSWLCLPGPILVNRHVRNNKTDPLVDEAELIQANTQHRHVCFQDGVESTVSRRHLAPVGAVDLEINPADNGTELPMGGPMDGSGTEALVDSKELIGECSNDDREGAKSMVCKPNGSLSKNGRVSEVFIAEI